MMNNNGYELLNGVVKESSLKKVWMDIHFLVVKQLERFEIVPTTDMQSNLELLLKKDKDVYLRTLSLSSRLRSVLDLFSFVLFPYPHTVFYPVLHVMAHSLVIPDGYNGTGPHQDWSSTQGSLDTTTVWIPITNTKDNFPLEVISGSHRQGLLPGITNGSVLEVEASNWDFDPINAGFGDAIVMSGFAIHRTGFGGEGLRVAVSMRYEKIDDETFVERGYPCAQKRAVDREIAWKPTVDQVRSVYVD